jgi:succinoglycan biosynthesis transport protein ExoP
MQTNSGSTGLTLFTVLKVLRRRKFYLIVPTIVLAAGFTYYAQRLPDVYRAQAVLATDRPLAESAEADLNVQRHMQAVREILFSRSLLEPVIREYELYDLEVTVKPEDAIAAMRERLDIRADENSLSLSFTGGHPEQVMQVTNRLAELFIRHYGDAYGRRVQKTSGLLEAEVERLRQRLDAQTEGLRAYKQRVVPELPEHLATNVKLLENLQFQIQSKTDKITEEQARRAAVVDELRALEAQGALETRETYTPSPAEVKLEDLRLQLRELQAKYTPRHPEVARLTKEIRELEAIHRPAPKGSGTPSPLAMRHMTLKAELESIDRRIKSYEQERRSLTSEMGRYESRIRSAPRHESELARRMREMEVTRAEYEALVAKQHQAGLSHRLETASDSASFRLIEPATVPAEPFSPKRERMVLMGLLAGLGVGMALLLALEQIDTSFDTSESFQNFTNLPVLSVIPNIRPSWRGAEKKNGRRGSLLELCGNSNAQVISPVEQRRLRKNRLVVLGDPGSVPAEQYAILALKVLQWMAQGGARMLAVTSSAGGEGKSLTSLNLALAVAASAEGRVLLLDCDLRRPRVHEYLGLRPKKGVSDLLAEPDAKLEDYVYRLGGLEVVPGGGHAKAPIGLLASRRTADLFARLRQEYAFVLVDTPPVVPVADSHILCGLADGVVVVVRARRTRRELFRRAIESLGAANLIGVVLNDVEYGDTRYAYAYRYYQQHYLGR